MQAAAFRRALIPDWRPRGGPAVEQSPEPGLTLALYAYGQRSARLLEIR